MRACVAIGFLMILAGCEVGPNYHEPAVLSGQVSPHLVDGQEPAFDGFAPPPPRWWQLYDDPELNALEQKALARNTDLRAALANLEQTQAALGEVQDKRLPQSSLTVNPTYGQLSADANGVSKPLRPGPFYVGLANLSYDIDLFGRLRRAVEEGRADVGEAQAALDYARVNVAGETANAYTAACAAGLEIAVTQRLIGLTQQALVVTQRRYDAGLEGVNDVFRQRTLLEQTEANLPSFITQQQTALYSLASLTGDPPEDFPTAVASCDTPPVITNPIPIGNGATLLARRPDVREAERRLAANVAGIGVSTAALFPSVTIAGGFGTEAVVFSHISQDRAFEWNAGPLITWNFPNLSVALDEVAESKASAREALANFDGTVLTALRETETSLMTLTQQMATVRELATARDDAAQADANTAHLYQGGVGQFLDVLSAQQALISTEFALAKATAQVSQDQIALFMSLGGGWQNAPNIAEPSLKSVAYKN